MEATELWTWYAATIVIILGTFALFWYNGWVVDPEDEKKRQRALARQWESRP